MSNIYIHEPLSNGKVLLVTSVGDIDIELWSKEAPKACRNFVQLCMEGYYDGTIFHRVVPDFIVQGGDPTGTGTGGESIYGAPFKDEFHSRLKFHRRGLVAMANAGPNDNGSQFFFTMGQTPELNKKHTIFGKVEGDTIYNMIKLQDCEVDSNERPLFPHKIIRAEILSNPFDDIVPRMSRKTKSKSDEEKKPKSKSKATKNFKLLSFGEEAEEEEHAIDKASESMRGKSKSSHDLTNDPRLSSVPAVNVDALKPKQEKEGKRPLSDSEEEEEDEELDKISQEELEKVRDRLKKKIKKEEKTKSEDEEGGKEEAPEKKKRREELREEAKKLQMELADSKKKESQQSSDPPAVSLAEEKAKKKESETEALAEFRKDRQKYKDMRRQQPAKGQDREAMTMAMLAKFKDKLEGMRKATVDYSDDEEEEEEAEKKEEEEEDNDATDLSWMNHTLKFDDQKRKVLDANINDVERYEIFDPRNPITKRRRENSKKVMKEKR